MELFDFTFLHSQMFWLVLCFVVLLVFMQKFAVPKISKSLDERAEQIKKDLSDAEDLRNQAQKMLEEYTVKLENASSQAEQILADAKKQAQELAEKRKNDLDKSLTEKTKQAEKSIESAKAKAISELKSEASKLVVKATEQLILDTVDAKKAKELTAKAISDLAK